MNQIILGDALVLIKDIKDESIDLIATDPPYLVDYKTGRRHKKRILEDGSYTYDIPKVRNKEGKMVDHDFTSTIQNDANPQLITDIMPELYRVLKPDSALYMFCSMDKVDFFKQEVEKYFKLKNIIIWIKNNHTAGDLEAQYAKKYEMILYANKGRRKIEGKRISDVWNFDKVSPNKLVHQHEKPLDLMQQIIVKSSNPNDIVFDPFAGSGTTLFAAKSQGRRYLGYEIDIKYFDLIKSKLVQSTLF